MHTSRQVRRDAVRLWRLCLVHGRADPGRLRDVVERLIERHHAGALPTLEHLRKLLRLDATRCSAWVETATALGERQRADIDAALTRRYGDRLSTTFMLNPSLIGGIRITAGSDVYDGSVRARLDAVERSF
jgi:F-type H+-transporting ATPase subunit delta